MICDECNKQTATVFLCRIVDGKEATRNLCEGCAKPIMQDLPKSLWTSYPPPDSDDNKQERQDESQ